VIETPHPAAPVPVAELIEWRERYGVVAGITERGADGRYSLGLWAEEPSAGVHERWRAFRSWMAPRFPTVVLAHQVHGTQVRWHGPQEPGWLVGDGYDGHVTSELGLLLTVTVADCVPIYVIDRRGRGVGLLHAGWKGVAGGMLEAGVNALTERLGAAPPDLAVHFGVAICGDCYEVGPDVAWAVRGDGAQAKVHLDLRAELVRRAERLGIGEVSASPLCSACEATRFFSHRASHGDGGRMVAYLGRPRG
jgi:hypothetical protein